MPPIALLEPLSPGGSGFGVERFPLAVAHHGDQHRDGFVTQPGRRVAMVAEPVREGRLAAGVLQLHVVLDRKPGPLPQTLATVKWDEDVELLRTAQRPPSVEPPGCGTPVEIAVESENRARKRQVLRTRRPAGLDSVTLSRQRPDVKREPEKVPSTALETAAVHETNRVVRFAGRPARYSPLRHMGGLLAYLDPGSGSLILQAIVGGAAAAAVMGKLYWRRFLGFLRIRKKDDR